MTHLHPLHTTTALREGYERYLKTIYPFQDDKLRGQFWAALRRNEQDEPLVKGPLLEASLPYQTGATLRQLIGDGTVAPRFAALCATTTNLPLDRPLYTHQEQAIRQAVAGHNLVVATGTGSGKTESFLIPILDHLLREEANGTLARPGVRALLLYPMNALANDQLGRLRGLLGGYPAITYGRYTGETLEEQHKALEAFLSRQGEKPPPNELISREAMRAAPPHILLTNYAMLEYLLLRPLDTELFDGPTGRFWRFLVIDEAHVYDGAMGIEVGMLLRRLRDRVAQDSETLQGGQGLRCIATSATLGRDMDDFPVAADFAHELFDEPFDAANVIAAERRAADALGQPWGDGPPALYTALAALPAAAPPPALAAAATTAGAPAFVVAAARAAGDGSAALYHILCGDARLRRLQAELANGPRLLVDIAAPLFPELPPADAREVIVQLVDLAVRARANDDDMPLLPARYHVFARALEGAFACLRESAHADRLPRLFLERRETCPDCGAAVFELATCARCGVAYLVGVLADNEADKETYKLQPLVGDVAVGAGERAYFILQDEVSAANEDDLAEDEGTAADDQWPPWSICLHCGTAAEGHRPPPCGHADWRPVRRAPFPDDNPERMVCGKCRTRSQGIVYRLLTGRDAPVSVLATQLYSQLPPAPPDDPGAGRLGLGRKLLIFADSRQDAAFTAPYLERTANNILYRRLILEMMLDDPDARTGELRIESLADVLQRRARGRGVLDDDADAYARRRQTLKWLSRELTETAHTQGLEGLGLLRFHFVPPKGMAAPRLLLAPPWNLSEAEAWDVVEALLDTVRRRGGVRFPDSVEPTDDFFAPRNRPYYLQGQTPEGKRAARGYVVQYWSPGKYANTRTELLEKLLRRTAPELDDRARKAEARGALSGLWQWLQGTPWAPAWQREMKPGDGALFQLKAERWAWSAVADDNTVWRCRRCRQIAHRSLRGLCPVYGCEGELEPVAAAELRGDNHHYRYLYRHLSPAYMTVEEHTAQWNSTAAYEIQKKFIDGEVNILSCSTTFELGVDVGTLNAVFMRNVPPTTANYVQRAGRAGRRSHTAAYALTFAQRRSHDLAYYRQPAKMVGGQVRPPVIKIRNPEIVRRHMASVLIAAFLRHCADKLGRFGARHELKVGAFFLPDDGRPAGPELLADYLAQPPDEVRQALGRIVPPALQTELGLDNWGWLNDLTGPDGTFETAAALIRADIELFHQLGNEAGAEHTVAGSNRAKFYYGVESTIRERDLINEFSRQGVLPKYGFPVDVVALHTDHLDVTEAGRVELQRDLRLAISEFAPGSQIVAAKKVWTGGGLQTRPQRELETIYFALCKHCGRFNRAKGGQEATVCVGCGKPLQSGRGESGWLIKPEFGFVARRMDGSAQPGETRPPRSYTSRVYFDKHHNPAHDVADHWHEFVPAPEFSDPRATIARRYSHYGELIVLNHGPKKAGFEICRRCGYGRPTGERQSKGKGKKGSDVHYNPRNGHECRGTLQHLYLGHDFITDVLEIKVGGAQAVPDLGETGKSRWLSVLYALLEGASAALDIRRNDLNGTLYYADPSGVPTLVLYDDVPGGAGHVRRVADELWPVFDKALERVQQCGCGEETACHECLWNYYNQPFHARLARGLAIDFLRAALHLPQRAGSNR